MRFITLAVAISALSIPSTAMASDWWAVASGSSAPNRKLSLIDSDSIRVKGPSSKSAWTQVYFETPVGKKVYSLLQYKVDCQAETLAITSYIDYDYRGNVLDSGSGEAPAQPIAPLSVGDSYRRFICENDRRFPHVGAIADISVQGSVILRNFE